MSRSRVARDCLVILIALNLSGALPVLARVAAASETPDPQAIAAQGQSIDDDLKLQVRRARHPDTPGTPPGTPNVFDLTRIDADLQSWKIQLEKLMALPAEPSQPGDSYLPTEAKLKNINAYLNELTLDATLRIALSAEHGPAWSDPLALEIPRAVLAEIPGLGTLASNRMGDRFLPMSIDRGGDDPSQPARLKLSASLVQGLELGRLADVQDDDTNLTMLKYLATRQLLSNLNDLRYLKLSHTVDIPPVPAPLVAKLESLGLAQTIAEEQHRAVAEPGARSSILKTYGEAAAQFPAFVTDELIGGIAAVAGGTPRQRAESKGPLRELLSAAEHDNIEAALEEEVAAASAPFSAQTPAELDDSLRNTLADAKANTQLQKLMEMLSDGTLGDLTVEQRRKIMDLLDARKTAYLAALTGDALDSWQQASRRATDELLYSGAREQLIENLLYHAPEVVHDVQRTYSGDVVDPQILSKVFAKDLVSLGASETAGEWFYQIDSAGSYLSARAKYADLVVKQTQDESMVAGGIVDAARVLAFAEQHDFTPRIEFTANTDPELARRITARIAGQHRDDLKALVQYGEWMGFHKVYPGATPGIHEVLGDADRVDAYFKILDESVASEYPILGAQIDLTTPEGSERSVRLADQLTAINPDHVDSQEVIDRAAGLVDQGLEQIEAKIRQDIQTVGECGSASCLEKVVTSSMMLSLVMHGFPEFHLYEEEFIEQLLSPSLTDQLMRRYGGPAMQYGFGAVMLIKAINWVAKKAFKRAFPITNVISIGFDSVMAGYMRAALILILADEAYEVSKFVHERSGRQQQEDFYLCSAQGSCFTDAATLDDANTAYSWSKWMLIGRAAMDGAMFYLPMAKGLVSQLGDKVVMAELTADTQAFRAMRASSGDFGSVETRMKIAQALRDGRAAGPELIQPSPAKGEVWAPVHQGRIDALNLRVGGGDGWIRLSDALAAAELTEAVPKMTAGQWSDFEQAYSRLAAKIRAGQTYFLPKVIDRVAIEDAFKELELSAGREGDWARIEPARAQRAHAAYGPEAVNKINRAARYLQTVLAESPGIAARKFVPASAAERRLLAAFKRSPNLEWMWQSFAAREQAALKLAVPAAAPLPAIRAQAIAGGLPH